MGKPTKEQLDRINDLSHTELQDDQVYVFTSRSADTLPVERYGWMGEYSISMTNDFLSKLKDSYDTGVGLIASHNTGRIPFGRTFGAEVKLDKVDGENVSTLYIDNYIVTHMYDEDGNKELIKTEVGGLNTNDIVNHIKSGAVFDTSIGFSITKPTCSICGEDLRDYSKCSHYLGEYYDVVVDGESKKMRCDMIAEDGEGLENSLVYAGAVDRALIVKSTKEESYSKDSSLQQTNSDNCNAFYNIDDIKTIPLHTDIMCRMSKGNFEMFTLTSERKEYDKGSVKMPESKDTQELQVANDTALSMVSLEEYNKVSSEKEELYRKLVEAENQVESLNVRLDELGAQLEQANSLNETLKAKAEVADEYQKTLIEDTLQAGVRARGNAFNKERYAKYLGTLSVSELRDELKSLNEEFSSGIIAARVTSVELEDKDKGQVELSLEEARQLAAKNAMQEFKLNGGNLEELTKKELSKLQSK